PGGQVEIVTALKAGRPALLVTNTGPPVPDSQIERLLQPFQRLPTRRTGHPDGHRLGLSIVHAIAAPHHATLTPSPRPRARPPPPHRPGTGAGAARDAHPPPPPSPHG